MAHKVTVEPGAGQRYISTYVLLDTIDGVSSIEFKTPGGRVPKVLKVERQGDKAVITLTN